MQGQLTSFTLRIRDKILAQNYEKDMSPRVLLSVIMLTVFRALKVVYFIFYNHVLLKQKKPEPETIGTWGILALQIILVFIVKYCRGKTDKYAPYIWFVIGYTTIIPKKGEVYPVEEFVME